MNYLMRSDNIKPLLVQEELVGDPTEAAKEENN